MREDPAVLRRADVSRYVKYLKRTTLEARAAGIPTLIIEEQGWKAEPIVEGPLPFSILSLREAL